MDQSNTKYNQVYTYICSLETKEQWKQLSIDDFDNNIVNPCCTLDASNIKRLFNHLSFEVCDLFLKKLWTIQDDFEYEDSMIYLEIIQALLIIRLESEGGFPSSRQRKNALRQLAHVNLILKPQLLEGIAETINIKREYKNLDETKH